MKRCGLIIVSITLVLSLSSCKSNTPPDTKTTKATITSQETETTPAVEYAEEIANIEDFKCICQIDYGDTFVIEGDKAKEIYTYLKEQKEKAIEESNGNWELKNIRLVFQHGESLYTELPYPLVEETEFYGDYNIFENDYISFSGSPLMSSATDLKFPNGTYNKILEMISE